jgi:hypothetical protein
MSDEASANSGTSLTSGSCFHSTPSIVSLVVMWTYDAFGSSLSSSFAGTRVKPPSAVVAATLTAPARLPSFRAFFPQLPVMM